MINAGRDLYKSLFPENSRLREKFVQISNQDIKSSVILSEEQFIPWEIVRPHGDGLKEGYLCELYSFVRWRPSKINTSQSLIKLANIVFSNSDLQAAVVERDSLIRFLKQFDIKPTIISSASLAIETITKGDYDLIHFGSHGNFKEETGVSIPLDDNKSITPDDIVSLPDSKAHPFVFITAVATIPETRPLIIASVPVKIIF